MSRNVYIVMTEETVFYLACKDINGMPFCPKPINPGGWYFPKLQQGYQQ